METVLGKLRQDGEQIKTLLGDLERYSAIRDVPTRHEPGFTMIGYSAWCELLPEGKRAQASVKKEYVHFSQIVMALLKDAPKNTVAEWKEADGHVTATIEQQGWPSRNAFAEARRGIDRQVTLMAALAGDGKASVLLVPDTNALLWAPALEAWEWAEFPRFTMVIVPTVPRELDSLKINHRNEDVRNKAERLIRQLNEYRRRGDVTRGVPLLSGRSELRACPVEPNVRETLPWLDPDNDDDRLLASAIEVMRANLNSPVVIVTRDVNLSVKADHARIPVLEPPESGRKN